MPVSADRTG